MPSQRLKPDPVIGLKNHGSGFGLPSATKFQSGHLPSGIIPLSRAIPVSGGNDIGAGSDMDTSSDSDSDVYGGRYSIETSPQDDKFSNGSVARHAYQTNRTSEVYYFNVHTQPNVKVARQVCIWP